MSFGDETFFTSDVTYRIPAADLTFAEVPTLAEVRRISQRCAFCNRVVRVVNGKQVLHGRGLPMPEICQGSNHQTIEGFL